MKQQYFDTVMMRTLKTLSVISLFIGVCAFSPDALADDNAKTANTEKKETAKATETPKKAEAASQNSAAKQSGDSSKNKKGGSSFVDRDGDGIRDGKEHRFRRRSKSRNTSGRHTARQRRQKGQSQGGKGNGR